MKNLLCILLLFSALAANSANATVTRPVMIPGSNITRTTSEIDKLPADKAALLRKAVEEQKTKENDINLKINIARKSMQAMLIKEPFNKDAYLNKVTEINQLEEEKTTSRAEAVTVLAEKFTVEERKLLVGTLDNFRNIIKDKNQ